MESLSVGLSASPPWLNYSKTQNSTHKSILPIPNSSSTLGSPSQPLHFPQIIPSALKQPHEPPHIQIPLRQSGNLRGRCSFLHLNEIFVKSYVSFFSVGSFFPLSCFATEADIVPTEEVSDKINLEAVVVSIDDFLNKNPFLVAGVTFIWLFVIPLVQEFFRKYKFIPAIDAFRKLRDDPTCQLLDIREKKSLNVLNSPNLKIVNKSAVQVEFQEGDEEGFLRQVLGNFKEPESTSICILDK